MADLTYYDVQRAVQEALQSVRNDMSNIANQTQYIDDLQRTVQQLQSENMRHDPRSEQSMQLLQRDIQEMKVRIENIEKFCRDMSEYFRAKQESEREDQEYRSLTAR
jgi:cell shape-determining protein MreC